MHSNQMIAGIVLAAGESRRMGETKQLLPLGDGTILEQVVKNLLESNLGEIIVVLGYQAQTVSERIADKPVKKVVNLDFQQGIGSSIRKGVSQISEVVDAIMIALGDQPLVGKEVINKLIDAFYEGRQGIIVPVYKGMRGHPVVFDRKYRAELLKLEGDVGGKKIIENHSDDVLEIGVNSQGVIVDIDTRSEYELLIRGTITGVEDMW